MRFNSPCVQLARTSGRNHAAWLSAPANFPLDLRPIWRSAGLLAAGTSPLPWARRAHHHPRPFGHTSRQLHSRLCWFDSLLFAQTSFPPDPRPFPSFWPDGGINCRCAARVYQLGIVLKRYTPRRGGPTQRLRSPRSQITPCGDTSGRSRWAQKPATAHRLFILDTASSGSASRPAWSARRKISA